VTGGALHVVSDAEAEVLGLRMEALRQLERRYPKPESRRAMKRSLARLAETFSQGQRTRETFEWELLFDDDQAGQVWESVARRYSRATALKDASFLRQMLRMCARVGLLTREEAAAACSFSTSGPSDGSRPGRTLTPSEVNRLVASCSEGGSSKQVADRDTALLLVLASTGARRSEVAAIEIENVHLDESRIWLTKTKSGLPRNAWLHPNAVEALATWMGELDRDRRMVFPALSRVGRPLTDVAMSDHQVWKIVRRRAEMAGLAGLTPHDLRRFVVSTLLDTTHDLALVARVVGHTNINTTARYDRRPDSRARAAVETLPLPSAGFCSEAG